MRYDTYRNMTEQSPKAESLSEADQPVTFQDPVPQTRELFEASVEFDLHSVMAQTQHSMRPVRPKNILRKYR